MRPISECIEKVAEYGVLTSARIIVKKIIRKAAKMFFFGAGKYICRVDTNKVIFLTFSGRYECNPKWICEKMIQKKMPVKYIWGMTENTEFVPSDFPAKVQPFRRNTIRFFWHMATARFIIDNGISTAYVGYKTKKNQCLIETWHGSLGIKRFDAGANKDEQWIKKAAHEGKMTNYIISNSGFESRIYRNSFWSTTEIWQFGHARNDLFFNGDDIFYENIHRKICGRYNISLDKKLCMYAPTFRDDKDLSPYKIDYMRLKEALSSSFGGEWVILARFHSRVKALLKGYEFPQDVYNVSEYPDIQELSCIIHAGITDYSSWICEYILTRKPGFLFATDIEQYEISDREFLFPLTTLPFPLAANEDELISNIALFDKERYVDRCNAFLKEMDSIDDGNAAERIVSAIQKII